MNQNPLRNDGPPARRLGDLIAEGRAAMLGGRGLSQRQFAELIGVAQGTVSKWENGSLVPGSTELATILQHCDNIDPVACLKLLNEHRELKRSQVGAA